MNNEPWDVIVIGGGSAGLSATLMLTRMRRRVLVLDNAAPRNRFAAHMHGVLGRDGWAPTEFLETGRREVERYGAVVRTTKVPRASRTENGFAVSTADGDHHTGRRMLVATGLRDDLPDIPGLREQWGTGAFVCPYCDGWEVRDQRIAVLATGENSAHQAQMLRELSSEVTYFTNGTELSDESRRQLALRGVAIEDRHVARVDTAAGILQGLELSDGARVDAHVIFVRPHPAPNDAVLIDLGAVTEVSHEKAPWVRVDEFGRTSVPGLFAAGNVVNPGANVPVATAAGATAGAMINMDLIQADISAAASATVV